jgi:hypothetical protein
LKSINSWYKYHTDFRNARYVLMFPPKFLLKTNKREEIYSNEYFRLLTKYKSFWFLFYFYIFRRSDPTAGHLMRNMKGYLPLPLPPLDDSSMAGGSSVRSRKERASSVDRDRSKWQNPQPSTVAASVTPEGSPLYFTASAPSDMLYPNSYPPQEIDGFDDGRQHSLSELFPNEGNVSEDHKHQHTTAFPRRNSAGLVLEALGSKAADGSPSGGAGAVKTSRRGEKDKEKDADSKILKARSLAKDPSFPSGSAGGGNRIRRKSREGLSGYSKNGSPVASTTASPSRSRSGSNVALNGDGGDNPGTGVKSSTDELVLEGLEGDVCMLAERTIVLPTRQMRSTKAGMILLTSGASLDGTDNGPTATTAMCTVKVFYPRATGGSFTLRAEALESEAKAALQVEPPGSAAAAASRRRSSLGTPSPSRRDSTGTARSALSAQSQSINSGVDGRDIAASSHSSTASGGEPSVIQGQLQGQLQSQSQVQVQLQPRKLSYSSGSGSVSGAQQEPRIATIIERVISAEEARSIVGGSYSDSHVSISNIVGDEVSIIASPIEHHQHINSLFGGSDPHLANLDQINAILITHHDLHSYLIARLYLLFAIGTVYFTAIDLKKESSNDATFSETIVCVYSISSYHVLYYATLYQAMTDKDLYALRAKLTDMFKEVDDDGNGKDTSSALLSCSLHFAYI